MTAQVESESMVFDGLGETADARLAFDEEHITPGFSQRIPCRQARGPAPEDHSIIELCIQNIHSGLPGLLCFDHCMACAINFPEAP